MEICKGTCSQETNGCQRDASGVNHDCKNDSAFANYEKVFRDRVWVELPVLLVMRDENERHNGYSGR